MKTYNFATDQNNTGTYYIDSEGDIFETREKAELFGVVAELVVDGFFVGSAEEMMASAKIKYQEEIS